MGTPDLHKAQPPRGAGRGSRAAAEAPSGLLSLAAGDSSQDEAEEDVKQITVSPGAGCGARGAARAEGPRSWPSSDARAGWPWARVRHGVLGFAGERRPSQPESAPRTPTLTRHVIVL